MSYSFKNFLFVQKSRPLLVRKRTIQNSWRNHGHRIFHLGRTHRAVREGSKDLMIVGRWFLGNYRFAVTSPIALGNVPDRLNIKIPPELSRADISKQLLHDQNFSIRLPQRFHNSPVKLFSYNNFSVVSYVDSCYLLGMGRNHFHHHYILALYWINGVSSI